MDVADATREQATSTSETFLMMNARIQRGRFDPNIEARFARAGQMTAAASRRQQSFRAQYSEVVSCPDNMLQPLPAVLAGKTSSIASQEPTLISFQAKFQVARNMPCSFTPWLPRGEAGNNRQGPLLSPVTCICRLHVEASGSQPDIRKATFRPGPT